MARPEPVNILLVDDMPSKLLSYEVILQELGENLIKATSATEALVEVLRNDIAVVLTDVCMPDLDGFEFATMLRQHPRCERTAIIFVSAVHLNDVDHVRGYGTGAVDYVSVPVVPEVLKAKVKIFVELYRKTKQLEQLNNELELRVAERTGQLERSSAMLRQSEERLLLASRAAGFGTYDYDVAADQLYWSSHLRGLSAGEDAVEPMPLGALVERVHPDDRASLESCMRDTAASPDGRHEIEFRTTAPNGDARWILSRGQKFEQDCDNIRVVGTMLDITHRKVAEAHQALLMAELDHRVKNILANVLAIASLSSKNALSVPAFVQALQGRIQAMATAHDLLRQNNWRGADFHAVADATLSPFRSTDGNIMIEGAGARLTAKTAQTLALVLHELATNAVKHGALSSASGSVRICCDALAGTWPAKFRLCWEEAGGPAVRKPGAHGFGLTAIRAAANEAGAKAELKFEEGGLVYTLEAPASADDDTNTGLPEPAGAAPHAPVSAPGRPVRILVVEDEALVALELQSVLEADGHEVIGPAGSVARGLDLARHQAPDLAFLDINLGCETSLPIARELKGLRIPFVFITGYSDPAAVLEDLSGVHRIQKPHSVAALRNAISVCLRKSQSEMKASA